MIEKLPMQFNLSLKLLQVIPYMFDFLCEQVKQPGMHVYVSHLSHETAEIGFASIYWSQHPGIPQCD